MILPYLVDVLFSAVYRLGMRRFPLWRVSPWSSLVWRPVQALLPASLPAGPTVTGLTGMRPSATRLSFPVSDQVGVSVDVGTGNLMVSTQGLNLPGVNGSVPVGDTYNSSGTGVGSPSTLQANGWTLGLDGAGGLSQATGGVVYTGGDGSTWLSPRCPGRRRRSPHRPD